jgi:DNA-binding NarL/FixJ family response regulator
LNHQTDMTVIGECVDGRAALALMSELTPDLAILDLNLPGLNGFAVTKAIREIGSETRILLLTALGGDEEIRRAKDAGACGCLLKELRKRRLLESIREIFQGRRYFQH